MMESLGPDLYWHTEATGQMSNPMTESWKNIPLPSKSPKIQAQDINNLSQPGMVALWEAEAEEL